jgi:hypothetical protein
MPRTLRARGIFISDRSRRAYRKHSVNVLLDEYHPLCLYEASGLEAVDVDTAADKLTGLVLCIPGNRIATGAQIIVHQRCDQPTGDVVDFKRDIGLFG